MILMINGQEIPVTVFDPEDASTFPRGWRWDEDLGLTVPQAHAMGGVASIFAYDAQDGWNPCDTLATQGVPWVNAHAFLEIIPPPVPGHREVRAETKAGPKQERTPDHIRIARLEEEVRNGDLARQHANRMDWIEERIKKLDAACVTRDNCRQADVAMETVRLHELLVDLKELTDRVSRIEAKPTEMNVNRAVNNLAQEMGRWEERFADSLEQLAARADALEESRSSMRAWVTSLALLLAKVKVELSQIDALKGRVDGVSETCSSVFREHEREIDAISQQNEKVKAHEQRLDRHQEAIERLTEKVNDLEGMSEGRRAEPLGPWVTGLAEMVARHEARLCELEEEPCEDDSRVLDSAYRGHSAGLERAAAVVESCKTLDEARESLQKIIGERVKIRP